MTPLRNADLRPCPRQFGLALCAMLLMACQPDAPEPAASDGTPTVHPPVGNVPGAATKMPAGHPPMPGAQAPSGTAAVAPNGTGSSAVADGAEAAGGLAWASKAPLVRRPPASRMRAAEYVVAGKGEGEAVLTVFYFGAGQGGAVDANIDRWVGQFKTADGQQATRAAAKIDKRAVSGVQVTTIDMTGAFAASMAPMMATQAATPKPNQRMLGAIAEGPKGPVFFKLVGPSATVGMAEGAFAALVNSIKPAP